MGWRLGAVSGCFGFAEGGGTALIVGIGAVVGYAVPLSLAAGTLVALGTRCNLLYSPRQAPDPQDSKKPDSA